MQTDQPGEKNIAAIDLGSNSFHMVVAKVVGQDLQIVSRHKQRVKLASGLDSQNNLNNAAMQRGLDCLQMFAERLEGIDAENVRIVATHTLRVAKNARIFLERARNVLPYPIEIIPGEEEARLIYTGVAHTQPVSKTKLVIDIGGGSTEMIIGTGFEPKLVNSKQMGCVSYAKRYFSDDKLSNKNFTKAYLAARSELESLTKQYQAHGWELALGSSGTVKAIHLCMLALGYEDGIITQKRLKKLVQHLMEFKKVDKIAIKGILEQRLSVLAPGVAILQAIMSGLNIKELHFSPSALREGVMYEVESRFAHSDIRMRTAENLAARHHIDVEQANRVKLFSSHFIKQIGKELKLGKNSEVTKLLNWAALLHEVGLSINYTGYHRHSFYLLQNTNMPGFNSEQKKLIATLARFHRKTLKLAELPDFSLYTEEQVLNLIKILRLSVTLNVSRNDSDPGLWKLCITDSGWKLKHKDLEQLEQNRLLITDLDQERNYWGSVEWPLEFNFEHLMEYSD
ncbi:exopolyphosphatase [Vibrio ishigakensis]|uniref:exopolyphosphatase n=1 Tax=Vibrio ishigakensis TaxID=1481914 RepID=UPI0021C281FE|nr:exopolyphosphatase [Vibrio ishigakensis]